MGNQYLAQPFRLTLRSVGRLMLACSHKWFRSAEPVDDFLTFELEEWRSQVN